MINPTKLAKLILTILIIAIITILFKQLGWNEATKYIVSFIAGCYVTDLIHGK